MASPTVELQNFAQSVHRVIKNRAYDDITSEDGNAFVLTIADFINQFLDELENELKPNGRPVDWKFSRQNGYELGTAVADASSIEAPSEILNLIAGENRYVQIVQDGSVVANFAVVDPDNISNRSDRVIEDMCAFVGENIVFSRVFTAAEAGGTIIGDVTLPIPRIVASVATSTLTCTNAKALSLVKPQLLLILGVAKNSSLPDIVRGKLSPSYTQKYNDLLQGAIARNSVSSLSDDAQTEDYSYISGVGF